MFNKRKKIILSVVAIIVIFAGIVFAYSNMQQKNYEKNIELGINYLREEKYEEAILAFEKALSIDSKNEDVKEYLELSKVYKEIIEANANGDYDKLKELIEKINGMKYIDIVSEKITDISISSSEKEYNEKIELGKNYIGEDKITDSILTFESAMNIEYENNEASEYRDVVKLYEEIVQVYNNQQYDKALELIEDISPMKYSNLVDSKVQAIKEDIKKKLLNEKEVYAKLLKSKEWLKAHAGYDRDKETIRFLPLDVDKDGSLELLLYHETGGYAGLTLSVISYNKNTDNISIRQINTGHGGYLGYISDSNMIMTYRFRMGRYNRYGWKLENDTYVQVMETFDDMMSAASESEISYEINGARVSAEEYKQYSKNIEDRMSHKEMYELNDANIRSALGVEPKSVKYNEIERYI